MPFSTLLMQGFGVCRHLNPMTAAILAETGFPVRVVRVSGHMWTEAQTRTRTGLVKTWVVESSCLRQHKAFVATLSAIQRRPDAFAKEYYLRDNKNAEYASPDWSE